MIKIRRLKVSDAEDIYKNINDEQIINWTVNIPYPYKKIDALSFIKKSKYNLKEKIDYIFGIALKKTDVLIGIIDLHSVCWEDKNAEVGYWIGKKYWGKGYGTQAVKLVLEFGFKKLKLKKIYAKVFKGNTASIKILKKNRFIKEGILKKSRFKNDKWIDEIVFSKLEEDSLAS